MAVPSTEAWRSRINRPPGGGPPLTSAFRSFIDLFSLSHRSFGGRYMLSRHVPEATSALGFATGGNDTDCLLDGKTAGASRKLFANVSTFDPTTRSLSKLASDVWNALTFSLIASICCSVNTAPPFFLPAAAALLVGVSILLAHTSKSCNRASSKRCLLSKEHALQWGCYNGRSNVPSRKPEFSCFSPPSLRHPLLASRSCRPMSSASASRPRGCRHPVVAEIRAAVIRLECKECQESR